MLPSTAGGVPLAVFVSLAGRVWLLRELGKPPAISEAPERFRPYHCCNLTQPMNKKITAIVLCALTLGALTAQAQTPAPAAPSASWSLTPAFASQYMFRGVRLGGPSFQPNIEVDYANWGLGIWSNFPISDKVVGQSDPEIDPYGFVKFELSKTLVLQPGFTFYTYVNATEANGFYKQTFEPNVGLTWSPGAGFSVTPKLYYDMVLSQFTAELNAAYAVPLTDVGSELDFAATFGTYNATDFAAEYSPALKNWGNYWLVGVTMPFQVATNQKLSIGVAYTKGSDNFFKQGTAPKAENTAAVGRGVVTVSYGISF
jgi:uncharacterized protein (TIGR02001 family)